jgi:CheY-like chemotaxis protein
MLGKRIFVVEDEGIVAADLEDRLKSLGYSVAGSAASAEDALSIISDTQPDLVLMDIVLRGEMTGIEAADRIRLTADIPVVFLTSHADTSTLSRACQTEPLGYLLKPFEERDLQVTIELALYRHEAGRKLRRMERWLATTLNSIGDGIVATDNAGRVTFLNPVAEGLTGWSASPSPGPAVSSCDSRSTSRATRSGRAKSSWKASVSCMEIVGTTETPVARACWRSSAHWSGQP